METFMPIPVTDALAEQVATAQSKAESLKRPDKYLVNAMLAGAYVGVAVVLLLAVTGPLDVAKSPFTKLIQGVIFGVALTLVIFAGSELSTGNMMTMVQGAFARPKLVVAAVIVILFSFIGNLGGSVVFAWLVHESGILAAGKPPAGETLLAALVKAKTAESDTALFFRAILCNFLVCLGVWTAARTKSDGAKIALIFWCLLAFVGSGFEHVVANMTTFSLGMMYHVPDANVGTFARNMLFVGLGNLVGGGLLVGATYAFTGRPAPAPPAPALEADAEPSSLNA
jgi:nitrite transporter NirC